MLPENTQESPIAFIVKISDSVYAAKGELYGSFEIAESHILKNYPGYEIKTRPASDSESAYWVNYIKKYNQHVISN